MAYVRPIIRVRENDRFINRGCFYDRNIGRHVVQITNNETAFLDVNYTDILDGATISDATLSADGADSTPTIASGIVTLETSNVRGAGDLDLVVTFSDGRIRTDFLRLDDPYNLWQNDYLPVPYTIPTA